MTKESVFVYSDQLLKYRFSHDHPFNQTRVKLTYDLLISLNLLNDSDIIPPRIATDEELELVHYPKFIDAVKLAGEGKLSEEVGHSYGIGTEDTPIFPGMHEASALLVGATL